MLLGTAGFAVLMARSLPGASREARPALSVESAAPAAEPSERRVRRRPRCEECGRIESIGASHDPAESSREITVRLDDGSSRVIVDANPAAWRPGERVMVIDGRVGPGA
jgi:hypothetical protein